MGARPGDVRERAFGSTKGLGLSDAGRIGGDWTEEDENCVDGPARGIPSGLRSNERGELGPGTGCVDVRDLRLGRRGGRGNCEEGVASCTRA